MRKRPLGADWFGKRFGCVKYTVLSTNPSLSSRPLNRPSCLMKTTEPYLMAFSLKCFMRNGPIIIH